MLLKLMLLKLMIKLNILSMLLKIDAHGAPFYASPCKQVIMSNYAISSYMPLAVTNILQALMIAFENEIMSPRISSLRKTERHQLPMLYLTPSMEMKMMWILG